MNEKTKKILRAVYAVLITAALIVAGLCLIVACVGIYRSGDRPFSREAVAAAFGGIAAPVYAALGVILLGFVLSLFCPSAETERKPDMLLPTWRRLTARAELDDAARRAVAAERRRRLIHRIVTAALLVIGAAVFLVYACNFEHFHRSEINSSMVKAMWVLLPSVGVPFLYAVFAAYDTRASLRREVAILKGCPQRPTAREDEDAPDGHLLTVARLAILAVAVIAIVIGLFTDGFADVLTKAVNICTECIGLG